MQRMKFRCWLHNMLLMSRTSAVEETNSYPLPNMRARTMSVVWGATLLLVAVTTSCSKTNNIQIQQQDSEALRTLRAAIAAAYAVYATMQPGGYNNFAGTVPDANGDIPNATTKALDALKGEEPNIAFQDIASKMVRPNRAALLNIVWVHVNETILDSDNTDILLTNYTNPNAFTRNSSPIAASTHIRAGDLIRMGTISASGSSFCVILVADDSHARVSGEGWQAVSAELTQVGYGADCGAEADPTSIWHEMPDTPGTDLSLSITTGNIS